MASKLNASERLSAVRSPVFPETNRCYSLAPVSGRIARCQRDDAIHQLNGQTRLTAGCSDSKLKTLNRKTIPQGSLGKGSPIGPTQAPKSR